MTDSAKYWTYLIYNIFLDGMIWGGWAYLVFWKGHSAWWTVLAFVLSSGITSAERWGKITGNTNNE